MKIYIKSSLQHGRGVFAREPISAGEPIVTFTGPLLTRAEVREEDYHLQVGTDLYLGASGAADDYVNHSCEPNAGFREGLVLVARRDIGPQEEITWDYSTAIDEADFPGFACCCGAVACRGAVRSFRHLDPDMRERLRDWLLPYLREKYFP
jgi:SET domain-containing protein